MTDKTSQSKEYEVTASNQIVPVASPALLLAEVLDRLTALEEREKAREERLTALEEENRALRAEAARRDGEIAALREGLSDKGAKIVGLEIAQDDLEERVTNQFTSACYQLTSGTKTAARIEELKARLKRRRGRATFSELREEMGLSKTQFSKLAGHLDKRIFDIQRHPRKAREKVLILRQQIG